MKTQKRLEWTIEMAAMEFDINPRTLSKRLKQLGLEPCLAEGKRFSTKQIRDAVHGDIDGERLGKTRAERELLEVELSKERGKVLVTADVLRVWTGMGYAIKQVIRGSSLSDSEKADCFRQLRELKKQDFIKDKPDET